MVLVMCTIRNIFLYSFLFSTFLIPGSANGEVGKWRHFLLSIPSNKQTLRLSIRQTNPLFPEYEYRISGKRIDGSKFSKDLNPQNGGSPLLFVNYIPHTPGYLQFNLASNNQSIRPEFLNLNSGKLVELQSSKIKNSCHLGHIGRDLEFHKSTPWDDSHALSDLSLSEGDSDQAIKRARNELKIARKLNDNQKISTSLVQLALALQLIKEKNSNLIVQVFNEAIEKSSNKRSSSAKNDCFIKTWSIYSSMASFYNRKGDYKNEYDCLKKSIALVREFPEKKTDLEILKLRLAKNALHQNDTKTATDLICSVDSMNRSFKDKRKYWGDIFPYIVLLENDIWRNLVTKNQKYTIESTFQVNPSGEITNIKIAKIKGDKDICFHIAYRAIRASTPLSTKLPIANPIDCRAVMKSEPKGSSVKIEMINQSSN